ncbi:WD40-repeat-containing domain protein [Limtongia smithiae]|uniref:WD40-repeat-containing domain protein n=1 Tax=Limtongia smithiae TaxID=1125753 RepID=UPI0034CEF6A1
MDNLIPPAMLGKRNSFSVLQSTPTAVGLRSSSGAYATPGQPGLMESALPSSTRRAAYYASYRPLYAVDWSRGMHHRDTGQIAVATCKEDGDNRIQILQTMPASEAQPNGQIVQSLSFHLQAEGPHQYPSYPCTRVMWDPAGRSAASPNVERLASAGDFLRIWEYNAETLSFRQVSLLANKAKSEFNAPLTSLDWNKKDHSLVITSSIDTTCTIWDLNTSMAKTQLIAHDKEVFDARFTAGSVDVFASVGADGSVRVFDLRSLEHSTIIYEPVNPPPLLRISTNARDANMLATFAVDSSVVHVLDIRAPGTPVVELDAHGGSVNAAEWAPQQRGVLATAADDCQVLVWDVGGSQAEVVLAHAAAGEVNNVAWSGSGDWLAAVAGCGVQGLRV